MIPGLGGGLALSPVRGQDTRLVADLIDVASVKSRGSLPLMSGVDSSLAIDIIVIEL